MGRINDVLIVANMNYLPVDFIVPCYYIICFGCLMGFIIHFYTIPKTLSNVLGFREFDDCSLNLHLADSTIKKSMGRIKDVLIVANRNYVPVDFIVFYTDCNPACHIILGRPFLRTIRATIDMKEGNIRYNFR